MDFHPSHPLQAFWNLAAAPIQAQALGQALEHRLFTRLTQPTDAATVARQLALDPVATGIWLDLLWGMALLVRHMPTDGGEPAYMASPLAARFFTEGSAQCCAQAWLYRVQVLGRFGAQWGTLLRDGFDAGMQGTAPKGSWAQAAREQIDQEQRAVTVPAVLRLLDTLPALPPRGRFIDLGGGPGHVAIALAQRLPGWHGTVCDEPETADVARDNIRAAGLGDRLHARGCNLDRDAIGTGHDLIWCSSVLHFLRDPRAAVARMFEALNPGGLLLLAHAERADDAALSARVMPFYAAMVLRGKRLPAPGEVARWMADAGFADIRALGSIDFPMAPVWLHAGRRP